MANSVYVLRSNEWQYGGCRHWDGYWTGDTYTFQKEKYAVVDHNLHKAKKYKSRKRAANAAENMLERICNYTFTVEEVKINE